MKSFSTAISALAMGLALVEARSLPINERATCSGGGVTQSVTFDDESSMSGLIVSGYTITSASDTSTPIQGLKAESSPNLAYTGAASGWPPAVAPHGFSSADNRTFTVKSFYIANAPGSATEQIILGGIPGSESMTKEIVVDGGTAQDGDLYFIDMTAQSGDWSGLSDFAIDSQASGFAQPHAIDSLVIEWDC